MKLPKNLISEFVKITNNTTKTKNETTVYGSIVKKEKSIYVKLDGSDILTPVSTTADAQDGERVTVLIKNHTATVTGNISSPAARTDDVQQLEIDKLDVTSAKSTYATITNLEAANGKITNLETDQGSFKTITTEKFNAIESKIDSFDVGSSGIWRYKKWSSGTVELWGSQNVSGAACNTSFGSSLYRSEAISPSSFPFTVYDPILTSSFEGDGYGAFLWSTSTTTTTSPPSYYLVRTTSGTINNGKINFHVIGTWIEDGWPQDTENRDVVITNGTSTYVGPDEPESAPVLWFDTSADNQ